MNRDLSILIRNHLITIPGDGTGNLPYPELATVMSDLFYYGYSLSLKAFGALRGCTEEEVRSWWVEVDPILAHLTGEDRKMGDHVVYKNFPEEVLSMDESEYWIKQILMYGGVAALVWFFVIKAQAPQEVITTTGGAIPERVTSPKAA